MNLNRRDAPARAAWLAARAVFPGEDAVTLLHLAGTRGHLMQGRGSGTPNAWELPLDLQGLAAGTLRSRPPRAGEIEAAIEQVEDAVMPLARHLEPGSRLVLGGDDVAPMADLFARPPIHGSSGIDAGAGALRGSELIGPISTAEVEELLERLAARAQGRPVTQDALAADALTAARIVLGREALHHLGFEAFWILVTRTPADEIA